MLNKVLTDLAQVMAWYTMTRYDRAMIYFSLRTVH